VREVRQVLDAYGRGLVAVGATVLLLGLVTDRRWIEEPLVSLGLLGAVLVLRSAPVRLSKYSYLTQVGIAVLAGALAFGPSPVLFALGVGVPLGDLLILRKPPWAACINGGREVLAFAAAFGVYAAVLRATSVSAFSLDWLPAAVTQAGR
jgi:hypothetical protein